MQSNQFKSEQKAKQLVIVAVLLLVALIMGFLFINSPYFSVKNVVLEGNKYLTEEEVLHIASVPENANIFRIGLAEIEGKMKQDLRIEAIEITRKYPSTLVFHIQERKPVAYVANAYGFVEIDKHGIVLAAYKNLRQVKVPIITGVKLGSVYVGDTVNNNELNLVLSFIELLDENTLNNLSEISLYNQSITAYTTTSTKIRIGNRDRLAEKARLTQEVVQELKEKNMAVEYVDLNFTSPTIKFNK